MSLRIFNKGAQLYRRSPFCYGRSGPHIGGDILWALLHSCAVCCTHNVCSAREMLGCGGWQNHIRIVKKTETGTRSIISPSYSKNMYLLFLRNRFTVRNLIKLSDVPMRLIRSNKVCCGVFLPRRTNKLLTRITILYKYMMWTSGARVRTGVPRTIRTKMYRSMRAGLLTRETTVGGAGCSGRSRFRV